jgi:NAD(P)-dependent dehydrogenase (short-subunit alcohol dehydrogenase family)
VDLLRRGVTLHLLGRRTDPLPELERLAEASKTPVHRHRVDLRDDDRISKLLEELTSNLSSLDLLIHSAGVIGHARIEHTTIEEFDAQMRVNVRAPFLLTRGLLPLLEAARGQIVFINSGAANRPTPNTGPYASSKAGLRALADCLREEVNRQGIRVISVYPGRTATPMQEAIHRWESRAYYPERLLQPSDISDAILTALVAPRTAETTDLHIRPFQKMSDQSARSREGHG